MKRFTIGFDRHESRENKLLRIEGSFEGLDLRSSDYDSIFESVPSPAVEGANFAESCLADRVVSDKNLSNASFFGSDLTRVKFYRCNLDGIDLTNAVIDGAELVRCSVIGVKGLDRTRGVMTLRSCRFGGWPLQYFSRSGLLGSATTARSRSSVAVQPKWLWLIIGRLLFVSGLPWWARTRDGRLVIQVINDASEIDSLVGSGVGFAVLVYCGLGGLICIQTGATVLAAILLWPVGGFLVFVGTCIVCVLLQFFAWIFGFSD